jgi:hypothetical protein
MGEVMKKKINSDIKKNASEEKKSKRNRSYVKIK